MPEDHLPRLRDIPPPPNADDLEEAALDLARATEFAALQDAEADAHDPLSRALGWANQLVATSRRRIRQLLTGRRFVAGVWAGIVVSIDDRARRLCTVRLIETGAVIGQVQADPSLPVVGGQYAIRRTVRLNLAAERGAPAEEQWSLKVPGASRWIYRKQVGTTTLLRWAWPPPGVDEPWEAEVVHAGLPTDTGLFGSSTGPDEHTQIVLSGTGTMVADEGGEVSFNSFLVPYTHYDEMGFGAVARAYTNSPDYARLFSIANDGQNTASSNIVYTPIEFCGAFCTPGERFETSHFTCTGTLCVTIGDDTQCITDTRTLHCYGDRGPGDTPTECATIPQWIGWRHGHGTLGTTASFYAVLAAASGDHCPPWARVGAIDEYCCTASGCRFTVADLGFVWLDFECTGPVRYGPWDCGFTTAYHIVGQTTFGGFGYRSWNRNGPLSAFLTNIGEYRPWYDQPFDPDVPGDECGRYSLPPSFGDYTAYLVQTGGGARAMPPIPSGSTYLDESILALNLDNLLEVWAWDFDEGHWWRSIEGESWTPIGDGTITDVSLLSQDGQDAVGYRETQQVYTTDGGDTWQPCPVFADYGWPAEQSYLRFVTDGDQFVDEVA